MSSGVDLYWLPLGAGGWFVRLNGRVYEAARALLERRRPLDLYHSALEVRVPEGRFVIENAWPIPGADGAARGVVVEGPVGSRRLGRCRTFRYEVRRWRDGVIADVGEAVASPRCLSDDPALARRLLDLVGTLPNPVWGRDELATGDMWNSNSVVSWLLTRSGLQVEPISPPAGGRAPGWDAGMIVARRDLGSLAPATGGVTPEHDRAEAVAVEPVGDGEDDLGPVRGVVTHVRTARSGRDLRPYRRRPVSGTLAPGEAGQIMGEPMSAVRSGRAAPGRRTLPAAALALLVRVLDSGR
jgi:hypothetical protein